MKYENRLPPGLMVHTEFIYAYRTFLFSLCVFEIHLYTDFLHETIVIQFPMTGYKYYKKVNVKKV